MTMMVEADLELARRERLLEEHFPAKNGRPAEGARRGDGAAFGRQTQVRKTSQPD